MVVHDEFVVSVPKESAEKLVAQIANVAQVTSFDRLVYPTEGVIHGKNWGVK